jgi:rhomboid protease GluP
VPVTRTLLSLNVAVFIVQLAGAGLHSLFGGFAADQLLKLGATYPFATIGENRWETLVTACFLHGGIVHLALNMAVLWLAGPLVERAVGSARMGPMYLVAGAFGFLLSVMHGWVARSPLPSFGASGAISGVIAAAMVVGWRLQGWKGALTQAMARWLGFVLGLGFLVSLTGGGSDNAAHVGGAIGGAAVAAMWRRGYQYSPGATKVVLGACLALLVGCIGVVAWRDATDPFAGMTLQERSDFTNDALADGRCRDAHDGFLAVERLRGKMAPVTSLRVQVEATCGHVE